jgi:arginyl-tRNA synthetase
MSGTTLSIEGLNANLKSLGVDEPIPELPEASLLFSIVDLYRCYISKLLSQLSGVAPQVIFSALDRTASIDKGDLVLAIPRLRIKGANPSALGAEWASKVNPFLPVMRGLLRRIGNSNILTLSHILSCILIAGASKTIGGISAV